MKPITIKCLSTLLFLSLALVPLNTVGAEEQPLPGEGTTAAELDRMVGEDRPTLSADVAFLSQYVWRGYGYSKDSLVIQPSVTPSMAYAFPLSHKADNELQAVSLDGKAKHLFGGVTLSMAF